MTMLTSLFLEMWYRYSQNLLYDIASQKCEQIALVFLLTQCCFELITAALVIRTTKR